MAANHWKVFWDSLVINGIQIVLIFTITVLELNNQVELLAMRNAKRMKVSSTCIAAVIMIIVSGSQMIFTWTRLVLKRDRDSPVKVTGTFKADWQAQTLGVHLKSKFGHMVESFYDEDEWGVLWRIRFLTNKELNWGWALRMTTNQDLR